MKRLMAALCLVALAACGDETAGMIDWTVRNRNVTDGDRADIAAAIETLRDVCPGLFEHVADVVSAEATIWMAVDYRVQLYGWDREVTLTPTLSESTSLPREWYADGHTLYYYVGIGGQPGVVMSKDVSMLICGQHGQSDDLFVAALR